MTKHRRTTERILRPHGEERRVATRLEPWQRAFAAILRDAFASLRLLRMRVEQIVDAWVSDQRCVKANAARRVFCAAAVVALTALGAPVAASAAEALAVDVV